jgi:hypothetical protein
MEEVTVLREVCLPLADEEMHRTIARIRPLAPALAAVVASVFVSLVILRPPAERLLPGAAPADRGQVGALVLPAPRAPRPVVHHHQAPAPAVPVQTAGFVPSPQPLKPPAAHHTPAPKTKAPASKPKTKPTAPPPAPTPTTPPPVAAPPPPPRSQPVALKRRGNGPPAHSHSRLLSGKHSVDSGHHGPPPGHGKPKPPPPPPPPPPEASAQVEPPTPPATPPGHGGTPPGQGGTPPGHGGTPPGQGGTAPGHGGTPPGHDK